MVFINQNLSLCKLKFFFMKNILYIILLLFSFSSIAQKEEFDSGIELYDSSEELVPLKKTSITIGKCCQLGKAMSKLSGGMTRKSN